MLTRRPMRAEEIREYLSSNGRRFASDLARVHRLAPEEARSYVDRMQAEAFRDGAPISGHRVYALEVSGERVGVLHVGPSGEGARPDLFVYTLEIEEAHRRKGYGRAALELAVEEAREVGARRVRLSVFADNEAARALYRACGFEELQVTMGKLVDG